MHLGPGSVARPHMVRHVALANVCLQHALLCFALPGSCSTQPHPRYHPLPPPRHVAGPQVIHRDLKLENVLLKGSSPAEQEAKVGACTLHGCCCGRGVGQAVWAPCTKLGLGARHARRTCTPIGGYEEVRFLGLITSLVPRVETSCVGTWGSRMGLEASRGAGVLKAPGQWALQRRGRPPRGGCCRWLLPLSAAQILSGVPTTQHHGRPAWRQYRKWPLLMPICRMRHAALACAMLPPPPCDVLLSALQITDFGLVATVRRPEKRRDVREEGILEPAARCVRTWLLRGS